VKFPDHIIKQDEDKRILEEAKERLYRQHHDEEEEVEYEEYEEEMEVEEEGEDEYEEEPVV